MNIKKRGLSPVIASVLLIALALTLAMIVFLWARGFVSEQVEKDGQSTDQVCKAVDFDLEANVDKDTRIVTLQIVNRANVPIYNFDVKYIGGDGGSKLITFDLGVDVAGATDYVKIPFSDSVKEIVFYPMIMGSVRGKQVNKVVTCLDKGKTISIK